MCALGRTVCSLVIAVCILATNVSMANAMLSEAASLAITAAEGMMQEDDKNLEQAIIRGLANESEKQKLKKYVEKTRPMIKEKSKTFNSIISPAFVWCIAKMPSVGNTLMGMVTSAYIMHYESKLEDEADSDVLKKFAKLRENNIEAGQGLFEAMMDIYDSSNEKDNSRTGIITDTALILTKGKQYSDRYKSSAAAIATVLEAAGIPMQPEDIGDICSSSYSEKTTPASSNSGKNGNKDISGDATASGTGKQINNEGTKGTPYMPNDSVGNLKLDESRASINKKLGRANKETVKDNGKVDCAYKAADVSFVNDRVIGIAVDDKSMSTPKGIHAGSMLQDVLNAYGDDYMLSEYGGLDLYEYEYENDNGRRYYLRFAVKPGNGTVNYISIRYVE